MRKALLLTLAVGILQMATGQVHGLNQIEGTATQPQPVVGQLVCGLRANMNEGLSTNLMSRRASVPKELLTTLEKDREPSLSPCGVNPVVINPPAGAKPVIRLRCGGSILRAHPLLVVDGNIKDSSTLADIDPHSIASIEILKDAPATAIYGNLGASGVIIVTTKKIEMVPIPCAEPMEEVVIRTTACYKRTVCSYGILSKVSQCTMEVAGRTTTGLQNEARRSPSKAVARVYPNPAPAGGQIRWISREGAKELQLFTVSGQWVRNQNINGQEQGEIQLSGLPAGIYLLRFMGDKNLLLQTERFILQ